MLILSALQSYIWLCKAAEPDGEIMEMVTGRPLVTKHGSVN